MTRHVVSHRVCRVMSCHVMSCHVMSCHVMSCHVMSCHVMSCHVMSCITSCCDVSHYLTVLSSFELHCAPGPHRWQSCSAIVHCLCVSACCSLMLIVANQSLRHLMLSCQALVAKSLCKTFKAYFSTSKRLRYHQHITSLMA